jgi:hypothetical protein
MGASLGTEAVREAGVAEGEALLLYYLVGELAGQRYLGGGDQGEVVVFDGVDLGLRAAGDKARPDKRLVAREVRRDRRLVAVAGEQVEGVPDQAELQQHRVPA